MLGGIQEQVALEEIIMDISREVPNGYFTPVLGHRPAALQGHQSKGLDGSQNGLGIGGCGVHYPRG